MDKAITFLWLDPCPSPRLRAAQQLLRESALALGLRPEVYAAGPDMVKFGDVLRFARERCGGRSFVWCNSDVVLKRDPFEVDDGERVHGFHRTETPSGEICGGVDMYLVPASFWDGVLSRDLPDLWCGATHVDWWLTNAAAIAGRYRAHEGFIDHPSHEVSGASKGRANRFYRHNFRAYNRWAEKAGATALREPISLPFLGRSLSPLTDFWRAARRR